VKDVKRTEPRQINFRISEEEYNRLKQMADDTGLSLSGFVKRKALDIKTKNPKIAKKDAVEIASELRRIGVNLNQAARHLNHKEGGLYEATDSLVGVLEEVRAEVKKIWERLA